MVTLVRVGRKSAYIHAKVTAPNIPFFKLYHCRQFVALTKREKKTTKQSKKEDSILYANREKEPQLFTQKWLIRRP
jgi:hypothetical protein